MKAINYKGFAISAQVIDNKIWDGGRHLKGKSGFVTVSKSTIFNINDLADMMHCETAKSVEEAKIKIDKQGDYWKAFTPTMFQQ